MRIYASVLFWGMFIVLLSTEARLLPQESQNRQEVTSQPASLPGRAATPTYLGQPVTDAWLKSSFAMYRRNLYQAADTVVSVIDVNSEEGGKPFTPKSFFDSASTPRGPLLFIVRVQGKICQFGNVKVKAKAQSGYVVSTGREDFTLLTDAKYLIGERIKATLFYCTKNGDITRNPHGDMISIPVFVEAKPASFDDFIRYIGAGNKLVLSYKAITVEQAKRLDEGEYRLVNKSGKPQYYQINYIRLPKLVKPM